MAKQHGTVASVESLIKARADYQTSFSEDDKQVITRYLGLMQTHGIGLNVLVKVTKKGISPYAFRNSDNGTEYGQFGLVHLAQLQASDKWDDAVKLAQELHQVNVIPLSELNRIESAANDHINGLTQSLEIARDNTPKEDESPTSRWNAKKLHAWASDYAKHNELFAKVYDPDMSKKELWAKVKLVLQGQSETTTVETTEVSA